MTQKEIYLKTEGNAWFQRNLKEGQKNENKGVVLFSDFYDRMNPQTITGMRNVLEIGCSYGYGLAYLVRKYNFICSGIDPSDQAVQYGNQLYENMVTEQKLRLTQGTSDELPYENNSRDVVIFGFCLYQVQRDLLQKTICEADRVLRAGGILVITDFDTPLRCKRINVHQPDCPTWKMDYASLFLPLGYTLAEKRAYSHERDGFTHVMQNRVSTWFLYKEHDRDLWTEM